MRGFLVNADLLKWGFSVIVPAVSGFVGVVVGAWLTASREKANRRYAFRERQLHDFYSPLLGLRREVQARKKLRAKVHELANSEWEKLANEAYRSHDPDATANLMRQRWPDYEKAGKYDERRLSEELLPTYRKMLSIFRDNLWLAEPETRPYFTTLLEFADVLERFLADSLPSEVLVRLDQQHTGGIIVAGGLLIPKEILSKMDYSESSLQPFYDHLESKHDELRARLSRGSM